MSFQTEALNRDALFTDETESFRFPPEPEEGDEVVLLFRTAVNDADLVSYIEEGTQAETAMMKTESDELFDYYEYRLKAGREPIRYCFLVKKGDEHCILAVLVLGISIQKAVCLP